MKKHSLFKDSRIILGVDPGTCITGYGVIRMQDHAYLPLDYGCIRPPSNFKLSDRYVVIFDSIGELIEKHQPDVLVVETQFVDKNVQSALKLGMARGAVIIAAKKRGLLVFQYPPTVAKKAVVGKGRASKHQVQEMIKLIFNLASPPPEDAADALALAICHAHTAPHLQANNEV